MDRNGGISRFARYDGNFTPITENRIWTNETYLVKKEHDRPADWEGLLRLARRPTIAAPKPFGSFDMYSSTRGPLLGELRLVPGGFYFGKYFVRSEEQAYSPARYGNVSFKK